jgi:hypothetical protein
MRVKQYNITEADLTYTKKRIPYYQLDAKDMKSIDDLMIFDRVHVALSGGEFFREKCAHDLLPSAAGDFVCVTGTGILGARMRRPFTAKFYPANPPDGALVTVLWKKAA